MQVHSICKTELTWSFLIFHLVMKIWHGREVLLFLCNNNVIHKKFKQLASRMVQIIWNFFLIIIWHQIITKQQRKSLSLPNCWGRYFKSRAKNVSDNLKPRKLWLQTWKFICSPKGSLHSLQAVTGISTI